MLTLIKQVKYLDDKNFQVIEEIEKGLRRWIPKIKGSIAPELSKLILAFISELLHPSSPSIHSTICSELTCYITKQVTPKGSVTDGVLG